MELREGEREWVPAPIDQEVAWISKAEVRAALKMMKNGKAVSPDDRVEYLTIQ